MHGWFKTLIEANRFLASARKQGFTWTWIRFQDGGYYAIAERKN